MRVLFLDQYSDMGGAQRFLLDLLPEFAMRGWQMTVGAPAGELLDRAAVTGAVVEVLALPNLQSGRKTARDWFRMASQTRAVAETLQTLVRKHKPAVVYVNGPRLLPPLAWAATDVRCVFHSHHFLEQNSARRLARFALKQLDAEIIACCSFVAEQWRGFSVSTIYNGVDGGEYAYRAREGVGRIGVVGRIAREKGQAIFVEAARLMNEAQFVVIGAPLFGDEAAVAYAGQLRESAPPSVTFAGWQDDMVACLASLDLLVVPSIGAEATTRVVLEAWALGVPVLASNIGGLAEIIRDEVNGFLVEPGSAKALVHRIGEALAFPRLEQITRVARCDYEARFTRARYARDVADLVGRLAVQPPNKNGA
jgi:glycosyltransferase involved in cell wall biosynthesis